ncbi:MAG: bifunctional glutamate N-acetyltransferase/amino-acid acetyltransferase ArgJ [Kiritimatiellae bacterium]|nr:bifunctional glutamate N-acetyltransferase/amino-acid acetyltransferase ArgJ [Kiritimatiellia bacterium]
MQSFVDVSGGVAAANGFKASGVEAGIKYAGRKDVALIVSDTPANVAAVYTTNRVAAAPVHLDRERTASGKAQAILANSGCANACTGEQGMRDARESARFTGELLGIDESLVLVCSTGVIGMLMPLDRLEAGARSAASALSREGGADAARAIMTTDTCPKEVAVQFTLDGRTVTLGGMSKGAGMIEPNMATMLAFLTTDAAVSPNALDAALRKAVAVSFNSLVVDGDRSTNDTLIVMANGAAGNREVVEGTPDFEVFAGAVRHVCVELAKKMAKDGEGASKFVTVRVNGAVTDEDAAMAARAIAKSPLVKTSWAGMDPNWGRVIAAAGYSGAAVDDRRAQIFYDDVCAYDAGRVADAQTLAAMKEKMRKPEFDVTVDLHLGTGAAVVYTCDLTHGYITINADYTT